MKLRFSAGVCLSWIAFSMAWLAGCGREHDPSTHVDSSKLKEAPDARNNPSLWGVRSKAYHSIATAADLAKDRTPWSDDYWPTFRGGTGFRWQTMAGGR